MCPDCHQRQALNERLIVQHEADEALVMMSMLKVIARQEAAIERLQRERRDGRHFAVVRQPA